MSDNKVVYKGDTIRDMVRERMDIIKVEKSKLMKISTKSNSMPYIRQKYKRKELERERVNQIKSIEIRQALMS